MPNHCQNETETQYKKNETMVNLEHQFNGRKRLSLYIIPIQRYILERKVLICLDHQSFLFNMTPKNRASNTCSIFTSLLRDCVAEFQFFDARIHEFESTFLQVKK